MILTKRFEDAFHLALDLHKNQIRKGSETPYIAHLMAVAAIVLENGGNEEEAIAALLHDAVEDQGGEDTLAIIREQFGDVVAHIVSGCSDANGYPKPPWNERKQAYLDHLLIASDSVRLVSASDKLHNARCILSDFYELGDALWQRFTGGKEGTLWYYRSLIKAYRAVESSPLVDELARVVDELVNAVNSKEN